MRSIAEKHNHNILIGVTGSANYSDEYIEKMKCVRYNSRCTLWNSRITDSFRKNLIENNLYIYKYSTLVGCFGRACRKHFFSNMMMF